MFISALTLLFLPSLAFASTPPGANGGIVKIAQSARVALQSSSARLSGSYTLKNVGTGQSLVSGSHFDLYPGNGHATELTLYTSSAGVRISTDDNKCISAQWGGSYDWAGVLYGCQVGPKAIRGGTVAPAKQWWLFVPARAPTSKSSKASKKGSSKKRTSGHHERDELPHYYERDGLPSNATHIDKRSSSGNAYFIVATDHLSDMTTRALSSSKIKAGSYWSTALAPLNTADTRQMWYIIPS